MIIKLVRHGQSEANVGTVETFRVGDHTIGLTALGKDQAHAAGRSLGKDFLAGALAYTSPFRRARQTLECLLQGAEMQRSGCSGRWRTRLHVVTCKKPAISLLGYGNSIRSLYQQAQAC